MTEAQPFNVLLNQTHSIRQKPECTRVNVECSVDMFEYVMNEIQEITWNYVKYKFNPEVKYFYNQHLSTVKNKIWFLNMRHNYILGFCSEPQAIEHAVRSAPSSRYKIGTTITYTCDKCYTGGGTSTCQCSTDWSFVPP